MTRYEKAIVPLFLLALLWQLAPTPGHILGLFALDWLLILSYAVGGYWLLRRRPAPAPWLRVVGGLCLGASLFGLVPALEVRLDYHWWYRLLPAASGLLALGLGTLLLLRRHRRVRYTYYPLFWRALLVGAACSFLAYSSIWFAPYRQVVLFYNQGRPYAQANLLMFEYCVRFERALAAHDTSAASAYLRRSMASGRRWLDDDSVLYAYRISGMLTRGFDAYSAQADTAYARADFANALPLYRAAYRAVSLADPRHSLTDAPSVYWEEEKALTLENIGLCLGYLHRYPESDSAYLTALRLARRLPPQPWHARLVTNLATSFTHQQQPALANNLYRQVNRELAADTTRAAQTRRTNNLLAVSLNLLGQDSTRLAMKLLNELPGPPPNAATDLTRRLYESIGYYKLARFAEARQRLLTLLPAGRAVAGPNESEQLVALLLLARVNLAMADYQPARANAVATAAAWKQLPNPSTSGEVATLPVLAAIDEALGNYPAASQQVRQLLTLLSADARQTQRFEALGLATELAVAQDHLPEARRHLGAALALTTTITPSHTQLLNTAAYLHYLEADYPLAATGYRRVLAVNRQFGQPVNAATAAAYDGLGLVALARHALPEADSLLRRSVAQHEAVYTARHPLTASAYLHYGQLRLHQQQTAAAEALFQQAQAVARQFLPADHDFFGDLALALGDLARARHQAAPARAYYDQALAIYQVKLGAAHWKTQLTRQRAGR